VTSEAQASATGAGDDDAAASAGRAARGILDTSAVMAMRDITDPAVLPAGPLITAVTLAELSAGPLVARDDRVRPARQAQLQEARAGFDPLPFDRASARASGQVAACLRLRRADSVHRGGR
jgi:tRNA(fMet)-specific endonuclease VapC